MAAILKVIPYLYTLSSRIPHCRFLEILQTGTPISCTIYKISAKFSILKKHTEEVSHEDKLNETTITAFILFVESDTP